MIGEDQKIAFHHSVFGSNAMFGEREGRYDLGEALSPEIAFLTFQGISICQSRPATSFLVNDGNLFSVYIETISCTAGDEHFAS